MKRDVKNMLQTSDKFNKLVDHFTECYKHGKPRETEMAWQKTPTLTSYPSYNHQIEQIITQFSGVAKGQASHMHAALNH